MAPNKCVIIMIMLLVIMIIIIMMTLLYFLICKHVLILSPFQGFVLEFSFGENEYFENTILTKEYVMRFVPDTKDPLDYEGPQIIKCTG